MSKLLVAILLNPTPIENSVTKKRVFYAARALECSEVKIGNLFSRSTRNSKEMAVIAGNRSHWEANRSLLLALISRSDEILVAWGVGIPSGEARHHFRDQVEWLFGQLEPEAEVWTVMGRPWHPSRWHQKLRTTSDNGLPSFEERISAALSKRTIEELWDDIKKPRVSERAVILSSRPA